MKEKLTPGFVYLVEVIGANGVVRDSELVHNLMPVEGENFTLGVLFKGTAQVATWSAGIYEGNYTPAAGDTAATFPGSATESIAYAEAIRSALVFGAVAGGAIDNGATRATFTMNANKTIYGGFISSAAAKGAITGTLLSAVRFLSPKVLNAGDVLSVTAGFTLVSA